MYSQDDSKAVDSRAASEREALSQRGAIPARKHAGGRDAAREHLDLPQRWAAVPRRGVAVSGLKEQQHVFESLCSLGARGVAHDADTHERLGPVQLLESGALLVMMSLSRRRIGVQVAGCFAAYCFEWDPASGLLPNTLYRLTERVERRSAVSSRVKVRYRSQSTQAVLEGIVVDVSSSGLAFLIDAAGPVPAPGEQLPRCSVSWKSGPDVSVRAEVVQIAYHGSQARVGVRLEDEGAASSEWRDLVEELQCTETARGRVDAEQVWEAYAASGYFGISGGDRAEFERERPAFRHAQSLLADAPGVGALFSAGRRERPEAYAHQLQVWPGSWLFLQLCRLQRGRTLRTSDDNVLLGLYAHAYGFVASKSDARWCVTYTHFDTTYSHRLHCEHAQTLPPAAGCVVAREVVEVTGVADVPASPTVVALVDPATSPELGEVRRELRRTLPAPYLAALALDDRDLGVSALLQLWQGSGLMRRREVAVARRDGAVVAAAILDFASSGLHVYGLLNMVQLVELPGCTAGDLDALLRLAHARYQASGHGKFAYFRGLDAPPVGPRVAHVSLGKAHVNVISRDHVASFLEHVFLGLARTLVPAANARSYSRVPPNAPALRSVAGRGRSDIVEGLEA